MSRNDSFASQLFLYTGLILILPSAVEVLFGIFGITALREHLGLPVIHFSWSRVPDWPVWTWAIPGIGFLVIYIAIILTGVFVELERMILKLDAFRESAKEG